MKSLTVIILTFNEELHIERCIKSILKITKNILIVDSFSTDSTLQIANLYKVKVLQRIWENNHAAQFNWALSCLPEETDWVMRVDADEYLSEKLILQINKLYLTNTKSINGVVCIRKIIFQKKLVRFGGVGSTKVLRMFRFGHGQSESRWMDEHIIVSGKTINLSGAIIDDNLQSLDWWIRKHENYAKREAIDLLNLEYKFNKNVNDIYSNEKKSASGTKRWIKEKVYAKLPSEIRVKGYYLFRYIFLFGFLDQINGSRFHYLQAYWYRSLADQNLKDLKKYIQNNNESPTNAIKKLLGIQL